MGTTVSGIGFKLIASTANKIQTCFLMLFVWEGVFRALIANPIRPSTWGAATLKP